VDSILSELDGLLQQQMESIRSEHAARFTEAELLEIGTRYFRIRDLVSRLNES
jgi:hypothetical protein